MTHSSLTDHPPLHTDEQVLARVSALIGPACAGRQLWVLFVTGDGHQLPAALPISGIPRFPDRRGLRALERLLDGARTDLATEAGPGSVIFALERLGADEVLAPDREWSDMLRVACARKGVELRGVFLSSDGGVRRIS
jgi:hypothetical protein